MAADLAGAEQRISEAYSRQRAAEALGKEHMDRASSLESKLSRAMSDENGVAQLRSECDHLRSTNRQLQMEIEQLTMIHSKEKEEQHELHDSERQSLRLEVETQREELQKLHARLNAAERAAPEAETQAVALASAQARIEELEAEREQQAVMHDSALRELRSECDRQKDALQQAEAERAALQNVLDISRNGGLNNDGRDAEVQKMKEEQQALARDNLRLKKQIEFRDQKILELEKHQDDIVQRAALVDESRPAS
jgi:chromosome segregation ATPase